MSVSFGVLPGLFGFASREVAPVGETTREDLLMYHPHPGRFDLSALDLRHLNLVGANMAEASLSFAQAPGERLERG